MVRLTARVTVIGHEIMVTYHIASLTTGVALTHFFHTYINMGQAIIGPVVVLTCVLILFRDCKRNGIFGGIRGHARGGMLKDEGYFRAPFAPYLPSLGIFIVSGFSIAFDWDIRHACFSRNHMPVFLHLRHPL